MALLSAILGLLGVLLPPGALALGLTAGRRRLSGRPSPVHERAASLCAAAAPIAAAVAFCCGARARVALPYEDSSRWLAGLGISLALAAFALTLAASLASILVARRRLLRSA